MATASSRGSNETATNAAEDTLPAELVRRADAVLIVGADGAAITAGKELLDQQIPGTVVVAAQDLPAAQAACRAQEFDIVVIYQGVAGRSTVELIHEFKLQDHEPLILLVSNLEHPPETAEVLNTGCERYILADARWLERLGPAVRHSIRMRKLVDENRRLMARLTEANILLEERNHRLDEFSATVAHDIRGPLGGLAMKLEYVLDTYGKDVDARMQELIRRSHQSAERLMEIVRGMYGFARLGAQAAQMGPVDLKRLVNDVASDLNVDERIDITIGIGELPTVWGNEVLLRRVFLNLISNAVKYRDKQQVIINVGVDRYADRGLAPYADVFVSDNGRGIPAADIPQLFTMFWRGSAEKGPEEGSGIGLAAVHRIIELHHGKVRVESELGLGTRFVMSLPLNRIDAAR